VLEVADVDGMIGQTSFSSMTSPRRFSASLRSVDRRARFFCLLPIRFLRWKICFVKSGLRSGLSKLAASDFVTGIKMFRMPPLVKVQLIEERAS